MAIKMRPIKGNTNPDSATGGKHVTKIGAKASNRKGTLKRGSKRMRNMKY